MLIFLTDFENIYCFVASYDNFVIFLAACLDNV